MWEDLPIQMRSPAELLYFAVTIGALVALTMGIVLFVVKNEIRRWKMTPEERKAEDANRPERIRGDW